MSRVALIGGATGLVGSHLLTILSKEKKFEKIYILVRREVAIASEKVTSIIYDYEDDALPEFNGLTDVFCALGTTIKKAGSKEAFNKVDRVFVEKLASIGVKNGADSFSLVSSLGANAKSSNFYLKVKGETEEAVKSINYVKMGIFRPSMILGDRKEVRFGENIGKVLLKIFSPLMLGPLKKYKGNHAKNIAGAMVAFSMSDRTGYHIIESNEISNR